MTRVVETDLLERPVPGGLRVSSGRVPLALGPFQILTLRLIEEN